MCARHHRPQFAQKRFAGAFSPRDTARAGWAFAKLKVDDPPRPLPDTLQRWQFSKLTEPIFVDLRFIHYKDRKKILTFVLRTHPNGNINPALAQAHLIRP